MSPSPTWTRRVVVTAVVSAVVSALASVPATAAPAVDPSSAPRESDVVVQPPLPPLTWPKIPEFDTDFYMPPADVVAAAAPGEIIAARPVDLATLNLIPTQVDAWQLSYRSNNGRDEPIPAVTTVIRPRSTPQSPRPLLSMQVAEDSLGAYCAPSYTMRQGAIPWPVTGSVTSGAQFLEAQALLAQGWALSVPDHQGPNDAFAVGPVAGRITLDGIRAAEAFEPLQVSGLDTKVGMMGYSGGAIATGHAAELAKSYAPELNIVGVAEGGTPAGLAALVNNANGQLGAGIVGSGIIGASREDPELAKFVDEHIDPFGRALFAAKDNLCVAWGSALLPFVDLKGLLHTEGDPLEQPVVKKALSALNLGSTTPDMPLFVYHSNPDWLVPVGPVNDMVDSYCGRGDADVTYTRDHFSEHLTLELIGFPSAVLWMRDRFADVPIEKGCRTNDVGTMALDQRPHSLWVDSVGEIIAGLFGKPVGA
ncbi:triacylglycerol lipase [Rhodococcus sp. Leaf7]|uniref:lipase family protein n=1 Tax=unclassified Rhodococcus (in: high G+C Gram-positive bacteria) TaxID=192944 RepID=UPI0006F76A9C|nr:MULTISPECIES: lipase family protein [unclassified Rhodococcus (in: high G+C Gram-positive bacteria)]KQU07475.1 triacylglycerol lipase [Rhodococcus sp. Leaf7]KQU42996.1 triacylglycerol lipase [Rhodococcus sp. Leaf247]